MNSKRFWKILLASAAVLLIPLVAMQLTSEVVWSVADFVSAWVLLVSFGVCLSIAFDHTASQSQRLFCFLLDLCLAMLWVFMATN